MIGVICEPREEPAVRELFELFKTPWTMFDPTTTYDAVIVSRDGAAAKASDARLVICFGDRPRHDDACVGVVAGDRHARAALTADGAELPLFCGVAELEGRGRVRAWLGDRRTPIVLECESDGRRFIRCGYNLFDEVALLLGRGQPVEHARTPTLDLHIAFLRRWLIEAGVEVIELHPTPPGCGLLASLTHDVDFYGIRRHKFDRTLMGFLYRASIGGVMDVIRGRGSVRRLLRNWLALLSLPLVHAGLLEDFWLPFERYADADSPWRSTFFVVPFRDRPGLAPGGGVAWRRGVPYQASEIGPQLRALAARGHEIAVHGIDAWRDTDLGRDELTTVREASGTGVLGVRMHWLYFDEASFASLEGAGFDYDATFGYNESVGFRAGTSQVFAPLGTDSLLELPLHIQDTSLLYPARMHCGEKQALAISEEVVDTVCRNGGVATISWHERSLSPERLWDRVYDELLALLRSRKASVRPAHEVVSWFRVRRNVDLEDAWISRESITELAIADHECVADTLCVRIHHPLSDVAGAGYTDLPVRADDLNAAIRDLLSVGS